jgi:hypothetical protein
VLAEEYVNFKDLNVKERSPNGAPSILKYEDDHDKIKGNRLH